jgi:molecular chaperone IbpA
LQTFSVPEPFVIFTMNQRLIHRAAFQTGPLARKKNDSHIGPVQAHPGCTVPRGPAIVADHRMSLKGGYAMRTFDLAPLYRSTVGFDRLFSMMDGFEAAPGYPPYNIERTGENDYRITVAVAGFGESELSIESKENTLTIKGEKQVKQDNTAEVLHQGIAARAFERAFQLADYVQVKGANLENGLLHVDLVREIPEAKKPRQIAIDGQSKPQVVESKAAA